MFHNTIFSCLGKKYYQKFTCIRNIHHLLPWYWTCSMSPQVLHSQSGNLKTHLKFYDKSWHALQWTVKFQESESLWETGTESPGVWATQVSLKISIILIIYISLKLQFCCSAKWKKINPNLRFEKLIIN